MGINNISTPKAEYPDGTKYQIDKSNNVFYNLDLLNSYLCDTIEESIASIDAALLIVDIKDPINRRRYKLHN